VKLTAHVVFSKPLTTTLTNFPIVLIDIYNAKFIHIFEHLVETRVGKFCDLLFIQLIKIKFGPIIN
jgi:hypothetical protein